MRSQAAYGKLPLVFSRSETFRYILFRKPYNLVFKQLMFEVLINRLNSDYSQIINNFTQIRL